MLRFEPLRSRIPEIRTIFNRVFDESENKYLNKFKDCGESIVGVDRCGKVQAFMLIQQVTQGYEISYLGIMPRYQRKGYGERLIHIAQKMFDVLQLIVNPDNMRAIALYSRMGFVKGRGNKYVWRRDTKIAIGAAAYK